MLLCDARLRVLFCCCLWWWCIVVQCCFVTTASATPTSNDVVERTATHTSSPSLCDRNECNCTYNPTRSWMIINCTFGNDQVVEFDSGLLPSNLMELSIIGGHKLHFHQKLFDGSMRNLCRIGIDGARNIEFGKHALHNITVTSLLVQINNCQRLNFQTNSFNNEGPVTVEVNQCNNVQVNRNVWNFLDTADFEDVGHLDLAEGAFIMKPTAIDTSRHGPVTKIRFERVSIPALKKDVFKAILAEVSIVDSRVNSVMSDAFSGTTISSVVLINTTMDNVHATAFSDRTQLYSLEIINSQIKVMHESALLSATTNLTVDRSRITTIHGGALNATVARTIFTNNHVGTLHAKAFAIDLWSQINIDNNRFNHVRTNGLNVPSSCVDPCEFTFVGNEVNVLDNGALQFVKYSALSSNVLTHFENNNLMQACHCDIDDWLFEKIGGECAEFAEMNYCVVDAFIAACFDVKAGPIIIKNFTDTHCLSKDEELKCKNFSIDGNVVEQVNQEITKNSQLVLGLIIGLVLIIAVSGTVVILLIHGGMWLKRKGYCVRFNNLSDNQYQEESTEIEEIIISPEKMSNDNQNENMPEELTQDLLQSLREKLEDPSTYEEAREMIERLYDHFITEDSYINNNGRQDDDAHLYEELGNLQQNNTPRPFNFLRLIEERFNLIQTDLPGINSRNVLVGEYSEPTDAEVHLYSELPNKKEDQQNEINESLVSKPGPSQMQPSSTSRSPSQSSNSSRGQRQSSSSSGVFQGSSVSNSLMFRPLPEKPMASTSACRS